MDPMYMHNSLVEFMKDQFAGYKMMIKAVCNDLGHPEEVENMINKYLQTNVMKLKKMKDPNAPKKPKTGFMFFCDEVRKQVMKDNPGVKMGGIAKILGEKWGKLESKEKYEQMHEEAKDDYKEQMENY